MKRYKRHFIEDDLNSTPEWYDKKINGLIRVLRDESFASEDQRKKMIDILSSLLNSSDKRARLLFKKIGEHLTEIGDEILKYGQEAKEG